jgi:cation:H+ antiporter
MPPVAAIVAGLVGLTAGGELLVRGSSGLAGRFGVSPLVIGLTVVAFGTSAPELAVALQAVRAGAADVAVGNVVGSNIFNVLAILGSAALVTPLLVTSRMLRIEVPLMIGISGLAVALAMDGQFSRTDGALLLACAGLYFARLMRSGTGTIRSGAPPATSAPLSIAAGTALVIVGLVLLVAGAHWLVDGASVLARRLGISDVVIGLTIVAVGTSLPELAASVTAALRGQREMAIGNVLGSNILNLTLILGVTAVSAGGLEVARGIRHFDLVVMAAAALACLPVFYSHGRIARWEGGLFVAAYLAYITYLVLDATHHHALAPFRDAMIFFAVPLTVLTLAVVGVRGVYRRFTG